MRLTEKDGTYKEYIFEKDLHTVSGIKEWNNALTQKLGQLEDIEDELGIDLVTLFKALTDGIWYKKEGHSLHTDLCLNVDKEWVISCWLKKYECIYCRLKDYGKTWALTREELL